MYARLIQNSQELGYRVKLIYLSLPNPEMAIERVADRVAEGGHFVAEAVIRRRFDAGWHNFNSKYKLLVNAWSRMIILNDTHYSSRKGVSDED
jgi:predicted ABC-type ATPase